MGEGIGEYRKWSNWCQNEVYEETTGADSRDKVKHNGRSYQLFLERMMRMMLFWVGAGPKELRIGWGSRSPNEKGHF